MAAAPTYTNLRTDFTTASSSVRMKSRLTLSNLEERGPAGTQSAKPSCPLRLRAGSIAPVGIVRRGRRSAAAAAVAASLVVAVGT